MSTTKKGYRLIAFVYESEKAYKTSPQKSWGYRFFDENTKKVIDVSKKDLLSTSKKDLFNALSVHCYHAHLTKVSGTLKVSCEDGDLMYLPFVSKADNTVLRPSLPIIYEVIKKDDKIVAYNVVSPKGDTTQLTPEELKNFILKDLGGAKHIVTGSTIKGYNLKIYKRSVNDNVQFVLTRMNNDYVFPESSI